MVDAKNRGCRLHERIQFGCEHCRTKAFPNGKNRSRRGVQILTDMEWLIESMATSLEPLDDTFPEVYTESHEILSRFYDVLEDLEKELRA